MAYPDVISYTSGFTTSNATSTSISIPADTQADDLMLLLISKDDTGTFTTPTGWTALANATGANGMQSGIFYRQLTGSLSAFTIAHASEITAWLLLRIPNGDIPQISSRVTGTTATPNPPSLTHSFGAGKEVMWLAFAGWDSNKTCSAYPTTFTTDRYTANSTASQGSGVAMATLESTTNPQDPATFTISASDGWMAYTLAIIVGELTASFTGQTRRAVQDTAGFTGQARRIVTKVADYTAQARRIVTKVADYSAQTQRLISNTASYTAQAVRNLTVAASYTAQTVRDMFVGISFSGQTARLLRSASDYIGQTLRSVTEVASATHQTSRNVTDIVAYIAQTVRDVQSMTGVTQLVISRKVGAGAYTELATIPVTDTHYDDDFELVSDTQYTYRIQLLHDDDFLGAWDEETIFFSVNLLASFTAQTVRITLQSADFDGQGIRLVQVAASATHQTERKATSASEYIAQTYRSVFNTASYAGQALRGIMNLAGFSGQTRRILTTAISYSAQTIRLISKTMSYAGQTFRRVTRNAAFNGQSIRILSSLASFSGSTKRSLQRALSESFQTLRALTAQASYTAQTNRIITKVADATHQTVRFVHDTASYIAQTSRILEGYVTIELTLQTQRIVTHLATVSTQTNRVVLDIVEVSAQTIRTVVTGFTVILQTTRRVLGWTKESAMSSLWQLRQAINSIWRDQSDKVTGWEDRTKKTPNWRDDN